MKITIAAVIFAGLLFLSGCVMVDSRDRDHDGYQSDRTYHEPGPPPHAPAHGYRHRHEDGHDLEYDSEMDVYVVVRVPETYFRDNLYIRMSSDGRWLVSENLDRGWRLAYRDEVPYKLKEHKERNKHWKNKRSHDDDD